jgi:hypothetical protein
MKLPVIDSSIATEVEFQKFYQGRKEEIQNYLKEHGCVKFRGIQIKTSEDFSSLIGSVSDKFIRYIDGNSPRTSLSDTVYTSTEYDPKEKITMHSELSYSVSWPKNIFFTSIIQAMSGGETLIADNREILANMDDFVVEIIRAKGVEYIRNLHGGEGFGPSWQDTFESDDRGVVSEFCTKQGITFNWVGENTLQIKNRSQGIINHHLRGEEIWFNQIDQFHPQQLGKDLTEALNIMYSDPKDFPMYVQFADGTPICGDFVEEILKVIDTVSLAPKWGANEILMLDNEMISHGRNPFKGNRKVLVSMTN